MPDDRDDTHDSDALLPTLRKGILGDVEAVNDEYLPTPLSLHPPADVAAATDVIKTAPSDGVPEPLPTPIESNPIITSAPRQRPRRARSGDIIGDRYVVDGQIGRGGMGRVFKVNHQVLGKPFALKLLRPPVATNLRIREMFYREAKLASSLNHDNICSIVDFGQDPKFGLFMVMELLHGTTLFDKVRLDGAPPPKVACDILSQVAEAVRYIHGKAIIHGDIKSENILITRTPDRHRVIKLLDFGLARVDIKRTSRSIAGTPEYMAPELISGQAASQASDIYALGVLFYELLVGTRPFRGELDDVFRMHREEDIPRPSEQLGDAIDERADELILRATAKDPAERHADVAGLLYELRTLMDMLGVKSGRRRTKKTRKTERPRELGASHRARGAAEAFDTTPIPLAAVDKRGRVRVANRAFLDFLGVAGDAAGIDLSDSGFVDVYPTLLDDVRFAAVSGKVVKRVIHLGERKGPVVEVAVILTPVTGTATVIAGDVHMTLHPLGRITR